MSPTSNPGTKYGTRDREDILVICGGDRAVRRVILRQILPHQFGRICDDHARAAGEEEETVFFKTIVVCPNGVRLAITTSTMGASRPNARFAKDGEMGQQTLRVEAAPKPAKTKNVAAGRRRPKRADRPLARRKRPVH